MLQQPEPGDIVLATGESHTLRSFVEAAFEVVDLDYEEFINEDKNLLRPTDIMLGKGNPEKAESVLGWKAETKMSGVVDKIIEAARNPET